MKKIKILIVIILTIIFLIECSKKVIQEKKCIITLIDGEAFLVDKDYSILDRLSIGKNLNEDDIIKTDKDTTVELQFGDNSIIRVKENSILKINKLFYENENQTTNIFLNVGKILANPEQQTEGSSFEIETNSVTVGVRGTEFTVISDQKGSKVAVNTGEVVVKNKIKINDIEKIENIDPEIAEKIDQSINPEIHLTADEKIEVDNEELENVEAEISEKIKEIAEELEKIKDSKKEMEKIIERIEDKNIKEISNNVQKVIKKETVTKEELIDQFDINEFQDIKKSKEILEKKESKNIKKEKKEKENRQAWKEYESLFKNAQQLFRQGNQTDAIEMAKNTYAEARNEFGDKSRITAIAMGHLGIYYIWNNKRDNEQLNEAEKLIKQAINIYENVDDKNDSTLCHFYYQYAEILFRKKQYNEAKIFFNKSIKLSENRIKEGVAEEIHFYNAKANALKGLAGMYTELKNFINAEKLYKEAISIFEKNEGEYSSNLKYTLEDYKHFYIIQNKSDEAENIDKRIFLIMENNPEFKDELKIRKKDIKNKEIQKKYEAIFQKEHKLFWIGKRAAAIELAKKTIEDAKKDFGDNSIVTARAIENLGVFYTWQPGKINEAEDLIKQAINIFEKNDDKNDPTICYLYSQYAEVFFIKKQYDKAESLFDKSIKLSESRIKEVKANEKIYFYRANADALRGLANLYTEEKKIPEAEDLYKEAISIIEKNEGKNSSQLIHILDNYRKCLKKHNKKIEAENIDKRIFLIMENNPEFKDELAKRKKEKMMDEVWKNYEKLFDKIHQLNKEGRKKEAIELAKNTVTQAKNELGVNSRITAQAMQNLAGLYMWETNQFNEAEDLIKQAVNIYENIDDNNDPTLCFIYNQYGELFYKKKYYSQAEEIFNKSIKLTDNRLKQGVENDIHFCRAKASALNGLANLYTDQKDFSRADNLYKEAIKIIETKEGEYSSELKYILESYKQFYIKQNQESEAENIEKRILLIMENNPEFKDELIKRRNKSSQ